jgi:glycerol-3-phosphate dehydrogenase
MLDPTGTREMLLELLLGDSRNAAVPIEQDGARRGRPLVEDLKAGCPALDAAVVERLARAYGTRARDILTGVESATDLGTHFGAGLYQREVEYLIRNEWAMTAEDILWRRSKLGLRLTEAESGALADWLRDNYSAVVSPAA